MEEIVNKYAKKIIEAKLADNPLVCGLDDEVVWNRNDDSLSILQVVLDNMSINSLICAEPAEPYRTIWQFLTKRYPYLITPGDCETRTFLHDIPVTKTFSSETIIKRLMKRKSAVVAEDDKVRIITFGIVSPEQAFVNFSSVCFAGFVLFFSDYLADLKACLTTSEQDQAFKKSVSLIDWPGKKSPKLIEGPLTDEGQVYRAMIKAGMKTVEYGLVDSYFGNISYRLGDTIYISQTGSSLDELAGCIDPCPIDGSSCVGITASSELVAHREIYLKTENRAIIHGHPKFSVILSMDCDVINCPNDGRCHIKCSQDRYIENIPIVPGEVGTGPRGLCNTLPLAIKGKRGAMVWGHGLFTVAFNDFNVAFKNLLDIENMCRTEYFKRVECLLIHYSLRQ